MTDCRLDEIRDRKEVKKRLEEYVVFYNEQRPCYAIGYDTPSHYRKRYYSGELERKNTFEQRTLTDVPKFVRKRLQTEPAETLSTFENDCD